MKSLIICFFLAVTLAFSQSDTQENYYRKPLDVPIILSGTFGELRNNHFHSGIDIKTQQQEGLTVYAAADGYVSRIKVSHYGYGKALYLQHPNGETTVYAHLKKFGPKIEEYVKKRQYKKEAFVIELFPNNDELRVKKSDVVAYSGNTGGSGGPHLHFEIRDPSQRPLNPLLFGIKVQDKTKPTINNVFAYALNESSQVNQSQKRVKLKLNKLAPGEFKSEEILAFGDIGFGVQTVDRQDLAYNKNGVYSIESFHNGNPCFDVDFKRFSFSETKHINQYIDYAYYKEKKSRIQKLYKNRNNPLTIIKNHDNYGIVSINDSLSSIYKIKVADFEGNQSTIIVPIKGKKMPVVFKDSVCETPYFVFSNQSKYIEEEGKTIFIPKDAFYQDRYLDINIKGDTLNFNATNVPVHKKVTIGFDVTKYASKDRKKLFINGLDYKNSPYYVSTYKKKDKYTARVRYLGKYTLSLDTIAPKIKPQNFSKGKWLSKYRFLKVKITDDLSGIKSYRATINGKFILMEYDYKKNLLTYDFNDTIISETDNNFKLIIIDNVGNSSTFETQFFRKKI